MWILLLFVVLAWMGNKVIKFITRDKTFELTPLVRICDVQNGKQVKVHGVAVHSGETIKAPFTGRKCTYYVARVESWRLPKRRGRERWWRMYWDLEGECEMMGKVVIREGNEYALLDTVHVKSDIHKDASYVVGTMHSKEPAMVRFIKQNKIKATGHFNIEKSLRWHEGVVEDGEQCTLAGIGNWKTPEECGLRLNVPRVLVITEIPGGSAYITDRQ